jgi:hypothetical protein
MKLLHIDSSITGASRWPPKTESGQVKQLKAAGCGTIFRQKITSTTADRPQLGKLMKKLASGEPRPFANPRCSVSPSC